MPEAVATCATVSVFCRKRKVRRRSRAARHSAAARRSSGKCARHHRGRRRSQGKTWCARATAWPPSPLFADRPAADDHPPEAIKKAAGLKPPLTFDAKLEADVSPLLHVTAKTAPALMIHGDKDLLVPIEHSRKMVAALEKAKADGKLVTVEGAGHGYNDKQNRELVLPAMLEWFDRYLAGKKEN